MGKKTEVKTYRPQREYRRIDQYLSQVLPDLSRGQIQKMIGNHQIHLNDKPVLKKNTSLNSRDRVTVILTTTPETLITSPRPLCRLFEDPRLLVINKPAGIAVHPGAFKVREETIMDRLLKDYPGLERIKDSPRPGIVHRLDKETSGVLILAKDREIQLRLQEQFKKREVRKQYLAVVHGQVRFLQGKIEKYLIRNPRHRTRYTTVEYAEPGARPALTVYRLLLRLNGYSLVKAFPHTGRTHQIRVHFKSIGHPVAGDRKYAPPQYRSDRLALHASHISFVHPVTGGRIGVWAPLPDELRIFIREKLTKSDRTERE